MQNLIRLNKLEDLDLSATTVQFRNRATGQYITMRPDPRGGGALEGGAQPQANGWYFYQAAQNPSAGNVEVKHKSVDGFNWSNYDTTNEAGAFVAWNHAKRLPSAATPAAPHDWTIEQHQPGYFRIKEKSGKYLELTPNMALYIAGSTNPKIITRPANTASAHQQWEIYADKARSAAYYTAPGGRNYKEFFVGINADEATVRKYVSNAAQFERNMGPTLTTRKNPLSYIKQTGAWPIYHHIDSWNGTVTAEDIRKMTKEFSDAAEEWVSLLADYDPEAPKQANVKLFGLVFNEGVRVDASVLDTYRNYPIVTNWKRADETSPWAVVKRGDGTVFNQDWYPLPDFATLKVKGNGTEAGVTYKPTDWSSYTHPEGLDMFCTKFWQWTSEGCFGQRQYLRLGSVGRNSATNEVIHSVLSHEMGHCMFSDDFYSRDKYPDNNGLVSVMVDSWNVKRPVDFDKVILRLIWKLQKTQS